MVAFEGLYEIDAGLREFHHPPAFFSAGAGIFDGVLSRFNAWISSTHTIAVPKVSVILPSIRFPMSATSLWSGVGGSAAGITIAHCVRPIVAEIEISAVATMAIAIAGMLLRLGMSNPSVDDLVQDDRGWHVVSGSAGAAESDSSGDGAVRQLQRVN
jgi:hypothetical protein